MKLVSWPASGRDGLVAQANWVLFPWGLVLYGRRREDTAIVAYAMDLPRVYAVSSVDYWFGLRLDRLDWLRGAGLSCHWLQQSGQPMPSSCEDLPAGARQVARGRQQVGCSCEDRQPARAAGSGSGSCSTTWDYQSVVPLPPASRSQGRKS